MENITYNADYIKRNTLDKADIADCEIDLISADEIFVRHPDFNDYYMSNYGRCISVKGIDLNLLSLVPGAGGYYYYKFSENGKLQSLSAHRGVADIFCPNFWKDKRTNQLQAHHLDHNKINNHYKNLMLLPTNLHNIMNRVKRTVLFYNGTFEDLTVYEIMQKTGLDIEKIILAEKNNQPENILYLMLTVI